MDISNKRMNVESKEKLNDAKVQETMAKHEESQARKKYQVKKNTLMDITILKKQKTLGLITDEELKEKMVYFWVVD